MNKGLLMPAGSYIDWGSTYGTTGYGIRDNSGTLQMKNSGGAWANIGSGAGSGDVVGPANNTDGYIPQWNGADSKTLKNGLKLGTLTDTKYCTYSTANGLICTSDGGGGTGDVTAASNSQTWGSGAAATIPWTFNVSGTDTTFTPGNGVFNFSHSLNIPTGQTYNINGSAHTHSYLPLAGGTLTGELVTIASAAVAGAGFNLPHGVVPNSPVNGDVWTTTAGLYARINSGTVGPFGAGGGGDVATDTIWDATGDLVQGTGANTGAKLSAGAAGKLLRAAGAGVAVDWSGYIIALPNTTNQFLQSDGTNWNATSNPSISTINLYGTNSLNLGTASSLTGQIVFKNAGGANTATLQSGTTSGSYTLNLPLAAVALGDVIVGSAANQLGVVSKGAAVAGVLGWDAAGTLAKYTSMSFDNTAAQFYDSVAPTKLVKIDPVGVTAGKTGTLAFSNTDNATFTFPPVTASLAPLTSPTFVTPNIGAATGDSLILTGDATFTGGDIILGKNTTTAGTVKLFGGTSGSITLSPTAVAGTTTLTLPATSGTLAKLENTLGDFAATTSAQLYGKISDETGSASGTPLLVFNQGPTLVAPALGAATATSVLATGIVDGTAPIVITATSAGYTLGATYKSGYTFTNPVAAAATFNFTLPTAAAGLQYCVGNGATKTGILKVMSSAAGQYIDLDGTLSATGGFVSATAVAGNFGCFVGIDATNWKAIPTKGTWSRD